MLSMEHRSVEMRVRQLRGDKDDFKCSAIANHIKVIIIIIIIIIIIFIIIIIIVESTHLFLDYNRRLLSRVWVKTVREM
jgi:hypothetical protein